MKQLQPFFNEGRVQNFFSFFSNGSRRLIAPEKLQMSPLA